MLNMISQIIPSSFKFNYESNLSNYSIKFFMQEILS